MKPTVRRNYVRFTERLLIFVTLALVAWIVYLVLDLPVSYRAQNWDVAWIGFDFGMLVSLAATAWSLWNRRQLAIPAAIISTTMLVIDAWFDVVTSHVGFDRDAALLSACVIELPLAIYLIHFSRRAIRFSIINAQRHAGTQVISLSLIRTPLAYFDGLPSHRRRTDATSTGSEEQVE
jgi:hypothetical protein